MALRKVIPTPFGGSVEYWKVSKVSVDFINEIANIVAAGYMNEQTRIQGLEPVFAKSFVFKPHRDFGSKDVFQFGASDRIVDRAYQLLKQEEFFTGSVDV